MKKDFEKEVLKGLLESSHSYMTERLELIILDCFKKAMMANDLNPESMQDVANFTLRYKLPNEKPSTPQPSFDGKE